MGGRVSDEHRRWVAALATFVAVVVVILGFFALLAWLTSGLGN